MATVLDAWKVWPRVMMLAFTIMSWRVVEWFMNLPDPTTQQAGLVSVVMGAATGAFASGWARKQVSEMVKSITVSVIGRVFECSLVPLRGW